MNKSFGWGGAVMGVLLAACSSLIPPQTLSNPIGISGRTVQVQIGANQVSAASAGLGIIKSSFPDVDTSAIPISLSVSQSLFTSGFTADVYLDSSLNPPCAIVLTQLNVSVMVSDSLKTYTLPTFALNKTVRLEQQAPDSSKYSIVTPGVLVGSVLNQEDARKLQDIITTGGANSVEVRVSLQATSVPELPAGSILSFTFEASEVTLKF